MGGKVSPRRLCRLCQFPLRKHPLAKTMRRRTRVACQQHDWLVVSCQHVDVFVRGREGLLVDGAGTNHPLVDHRWDPFTHVAVTSKGVEAVARGSRAYVMTQLLLARQPCHLRQLLHGGGRRGLGISEQQPCRQGHGHEDPRHPGTQLRWGCGEEEGLTHRPEQQNKAKKGSLYAKGDSYARSAVRSRSLCAPWAWA